MSTNNYIENEVVSVKNARAIESKLGLNLVNTNATSTIQGNLTVNGTFTAAGQGLDGPQTITATSANALTVGQNGTTNPALNINTNTASSATGISITSAAAAAGLAIATISSGTNENLTIDAKGSGTVTINGTATGIVVLPAGTTIGGSVPLTSTITSSSATAFQVGPNGGTNPSFLINASATSAATGVSITSAAAGSGVVIGTLSSASAENLTIGAKGTGMVFFTSIVEAQSRLYVQNASNQALAIGANANTNPVLSVNASATSVATGVTVIGAAAGAGVAINAISSGTNEPLQFNGKGSGNVVVQAATATPASGSSTAALLFGTTAAFGIYYGSGAPTVTAAQGSIYIRSDGSSTSTRLYVNTTGSTTWTNFTSAA